MWRDNTFIANHDVLLQELSNLRLKSGPIDNIGVRHGDFSGSVIFLHNSRGEQLWPDEGDILTDEEPF